MGGVCVRVYVMLCGIGLRCACLPVPLWWWWKSKIVCRVPPLQYNITMQLAVQVLVLTQAVQQRQGQTPPWMHCWQSHSCL